MVLDCFCIAEFDGIEMDVLFDCGTATQPGFLPIASLGERARLSKTIQFWVVSPAAMSPGPDCFVPDIDTGERNDGRPARNTIEPALD